MTDDELYRKGLLSICQDLHMDCTGAGDLPDATRAVLFAYLLKRYNDWTPSISIDLTYDECVRALVARVVEDVRWRDHRGNGNRSPKIPGG